MVTRITICTTRKSFKLNLKQNWGRTLKLNDSIQIVPLNLLQNVLLKAFLFHESMNSYFNKSSFSQLDDYRELDRERERDKEREREGERERKR